MERAKKQEQIGQLSEAFKEAGIVIVSHYKGLTVAQSQELRGKVRAAGATIKVTKNRLTKIALEGTDYAHMADLFTGPTILAYANEPVAVSKALADFAKKNEAFVILGGGLGAQSLQKKDVEALSELPSLDELRAKIVGMLQTPATRIAQVLQAPGSQVARVISAYSQQ